MVGLKDLGLATGLAVGGAALVLACAESPYACALDEQCSRDGDQGVCQPSGYCSFADETCASGQRYGEHAGKGLAGSCVAEAEDDEGDDAAEGSTSGSTSGSAADTSDPDSGASSTTTTSGSATGADDDRATTEPTTSTPTSDDGADDGADDAADDGVDDGVDDTGDPFIECSFVDDFESGTPSAAWNIGGDLAMIVKDGMFGLELGMPNKYGWAWTEQANLTGKSIIAEVGSPPPPSGSAQFLLELGSPSLNYLMLLEGPQLVARTSLDGSWDNQAVVDLDAGAMRWVQIGDLGQTIRWSYSGDGTNWTTLATVPKAGSLSQANIALVGGTWKPENELGFVGVELVAICP